MFDIGFWEIFFILILALLVIGPERLPGAAKTAGYWVGKARRYIEGVKTEVEQELDITEFKRMLHNQEVQINELQQKLQEEVSLSDDAETDAAQESTEHDSLEHDPATEKNSTSKD